MHYCIARAKEGDPSAMATLVELLHPRMVRMAAYYARCSREDQDDLLQEAWVGLLKALPALDLHIGSPEQYLIQYARWRLLDAIKRARLRRCDPIDDTLAEQLTGPPLDAALASVNVAEFITRLSATQRAVLACLLAGLTWRETGDLLGCSLSQYRLPRAPYTPAVCHLGRRQRK